MQRVALREALLRRTGTPVTSGRKQPGPRLCSAPFRKGSTLLCVRGTKIRRSRTCECMPIPVLTTSLILPVSCPVRGASRGVTEVGQSESWPEGQPEGRCGACGRASQARTREALGSRPGPLRGSAFNGWTGQVKGGETCLDGEKSSRLRPEVRPQGQKSLRRSVRKALFVTTKARRSALRLPSKPRGEKLKAQLARRRGNEKPWLFEI
jgi:hypothetical protein